MEPGWWLLECCWARWSFMLALWSSRQSWRFRSRAVLSSCNKLANNLSFLASSKQMTIYYYPSKMVWFWKLPENLWVSGWIQSSLGANILGSDIGGSGTTGPGSLNLRAGLERLNPLKGLGGRLAKFSIGNHESECICGLTRWRGQGIGKYPIWCSLMNW